MKYRSMLALTALAMAGFCSAPLAVAAETSATVDKMKAAVTPGEFVLTGSEVKRIHEGKQARDYKICVKAEKDAAPMNVTYDGQSVTVPVGDCKDVVGKRIEAMPAEALSGSAHIVATFHHHQKK